MKFSTVLAAAGVASAADPTSYLQWTADSFIRRGVRSGFHYTEAVLYMGMESAIAQSKNQTIVDFYRKQIDNVVLADGSIKDWNLTYYSLDDYRMAINYLWWYERTGEQKFRTAADTVRQQLNRHPRTPTGGFWHRSPIYANQMWLDGIFMADSFYAKWTASFDKANTTAWDDIAKQYDNIESHTRNKTSGLLQHGYDELKKAVWADPVTGAAPLVWDRAVGWYFISLLETLQVFPKTHPGYNRLLGYYTSLAAAVKKAQDPASGGFWLIMNEPYPSKKGNYIESSATAMFTAGWLKGIRLGLLSKNDYLPPAKKAYNLLTSKFIKKNADGTLNWEGTVEVGSLNSNGTFEYYISVPLASNDLKGVGPWMLSAYEWETWASKA